jgi:integrase
VSNDQAARLAALLRLAIAAGCDVVTVQRALGHSSATVTLNTYAHLWPTAEDRTRAAAAAMLGEVLAHADDQLTNNDAA